MKGKEKTIHLNTSQVYRTKILVETLRRQESVHRDNLITQICNNDSQKIAVRTLQRYVKSLGEDYGIIIKLNKATLHYSLIEENSSNIDAFLQHVEMLSMGELISNFTGEKNNGLNYIEFENESTTNSYPNFKLILEATLQSIPITFSHYSFYHLKQEEYTLKPYFLKQYQNRWYVVGETEKGYRTFGIDRLSEIFIGNKKFKSKTEEAKEKFRNVIGLNYVDHKLEKIHLSFKLSQKPYLLSLPLHRSQKEINIDNPTSFDIELRIHPNFEFRQQILKYGSLVRVIEPKWLAEEISEELRKGFEGY